MTKFYARPLSTLANGFHFANSNQFDQLAKYNRSRFNDVVEQYEIQLIDGDKIDHEVANALGLNQTNICTFIKCVNRWDEHQKIKFILAVRECAFVLDSFDCDPDDFNLDIYEAQHHEELGRIFISGDLLGFVQSDLRPFLDYEGIGLDYGMDYDEADIAGRHFFFRCD